MWEVEHTRTMPEAPVTHQEIPQEELQELLLVAADAQDYAIRGRRSLGYALLLRALVHAERCLHQGQPWATAYLDLCREMIDRYCNEYDVEPGE